MDKKSKENLHFIPKYGIPSWNLGYEMHYIKNVENESMCGGRYS